MASHSPTAPTVTYRLCSLINFSAEAAAPLRAVHSAGYTIWCDALIRSDRPDSEPETENKNNPQLLFLFVFFMPISDGRGALAIAAGFYGNLAQRSHLSRR